ncbi:MAG: hypothetical protein WBF23_04785 [Methyloceanibacter sp.]|jgi:hypothetical protein
MRKVLSVAAIIAVGTILLACARRPPEQIAPPPVAYDQPEDYAPGPDGYAMPRAPYGRSGYDRAQLPPPPGYAPPPPVGYAPGPAPYSRSSYAPPPPRPPSSYGRSSYAQSVAPRDIRPPAPMNAPPPPPPAYGRSPSAQDGRPQQDARLEWRASPRWATTNAAKKKAPASAPKPDPEAKFKAAQAKAEEVGVENLTQDDIAGLSPEQITQLRGY